jgi:hypothetical protein
MNGERNTIDTTVAHPARRYDYLLGGKDNFKADRDSALEIEAVMPTVRLSALENRYFLRRAVEFLARQGVRQFLDIGSGIPTSPNTHEIAQAIDPTATVVYVDNDPLVQIYATLDSRATSILADLRSPGEILEAAGKSLDLAEPVGLLLVAVLHFIRDDEDPAGIVRALVAALPSGSWVVVSHATFEYMPAERLPLLERPNRDGRFRARSGAALAGLLAGVELLPPGVRSVALWWADEAPQPRPAIEDVAMNGAVGRI